MKRGIALVVAAMLVMSAAACSNGNQSNTGTNSNANTNAATTNTNSNASADTGNTADADTNNTSTDATPVSFEYYVWDIGSEGDNNIERALIEIYKEENPHVDLKVTTSPEGGDYGAIIATRAAANDLPDIFMWHNIAEVITRGWARDLTDITSKDPEYANVVDPLAKGGSFEGKVFMLPKKMNFMGMFMNKDIYAANNLQPLEFGYTMDELLTAIERTTTATTKGTSNYFPVNYFYPMTIDPRYSFATFDGENVNFNAPEFAEGISIYQTVSNNNWNLRNTTTEDFFGRGGWEFGEIAGIGNQYEGTWFFENPRPFAFDYIGLPNGVAGVMVNDYLSISPNTKAPEAAYDFAKWMSFGLEGIKTRLDLAEAMPDVYAFRGIPVIAGADSDVDARFLEAYAEYPGFIAAYYASDTARLEGYKEVPGLGMAVNDNDTGVQGVDGEGNPESYRMWKLMDEILIGNQSISDHADRMTELGNQTLRDAKAEVEAAIRNQ